MSLQCDVCLSRGKGNVFWGTDRMTDEFDTLPLPLFLMLSDISSIFPMFFFFTFVLFPFPRFGGYAFFFCSCLCVFLCANLKLWFSFSFITLMYMERNETITFFIFSPISKFLSYFKPFFFILYKDGYFLSWSMCPSL